MPEIDGNFPASRPQRPEVAFRRSGPVSSWNTLNGNNHVFCIALEPVKCNSQGTVKETGIKTCVQSSDILPCNGICNGSRRSVIHQLGTVLQPKGSCTGHGRYIQIIFYGLVTNASPRSAQLKAAHNGSCPLHPGFFHNPPSGRERRIPSPLHMAREL